MPGKASNCIDIKNPLNGTTYEFLVRYLRRAKANGLHLGLPESLHVGLASSVECKVGVGWVEKVPLIQELCAIRELPQAEFVAAHENAIGTSRFRRQVEAAGGGGRGAFAKSKGRRGSHRFVHVFLDHEVRILLHSQPVCELHLPGYAQRHSCTPRVSDEGLKNTIFPSTVGT